jgi:hypothetical protein
MSNKILLHDANDTRLMAISRGACFTEAVLPSGFKVPAGSDGKDWVSDGTNLVLTQYGRGNIDKIVLHDTRDVSLIRASGGLSFTSKVLPSGFTVPAGRDGKDWVSDGSSLILQAQAQAQTYNKLTLYDKNDLRLMNMSIGACFTGAVLPSGFKVPAGRDGNDWVSDGSGLVLTGYRKGHPTQISP